MKSVIIGIQCFKYGCELLCKKIAHVSVSEKDVNPYVTIFQASFEWNPLSLEDKRVNRFLIYEYNFSFWNDGIVAYRHLKNYQE